MPRLPAVLARTRPIEDITGPRTSERIVVAAMPWPDAIQHLRTLFGPDAVVRINGEETDVLSRGARVESIVVTRDEYGIVLDVFAIFEP
jgi:hypothetical protein